MDNTPCWLGVRPLWKRVPVVETHTRDDGTEVPVPIEGEYTREQTGWESFSEESEAAVTANLEKRDAGDDYFEGFRYFEVTVSDAGKPKLTEVQLG